MDDWRRNLVTDDDGMRAILREGKAVAVVGAKAGADEPSYAVPAYLAAHGYRIFPVNPKLAGQSLHGQIVVATVGDLAQPVDVIEVFRRPVFLPGHAEEILSMPWRPRVVWFQLGIRHDGAAATLARAGITVVQDRCMMPEHRRLIGAA